MTTWFCFAIIAIIAFAGNSNLKSIPEGLQNLTEYITEFIRDLAKLKLVKKNMLNGYRFRTILFVFVSNWSGALIPWHLIEIQMVN
jgi:F-type H+-transporting ATPase subunit a